MKNFIGIKYCATSANLLIWYDHYAKRGGGVSWDMREVLSP
jgi:hypothetical protein